MEFNELFSEEEWNEMNERFLNDGIYDVTGIPFIEYDYKNPNLALDFIKENPDYVIACAYETYSVILLKEKPNKISKEIKLYGSGFHYGSTNLLEGCPHSILILAEND